MLLFTNIYLGFEDLALWVLSVYMFPVTWHNKNITVHCSADCAAPVENGDTEMSTEEPWDQKDAEPNEEEPGGGDRGPAVQAETEEMTSEIMEEEEEAPVPKVPPTQPDAPRKEHINVVFIGHVGQ